MDEQPGESPDLLEFGGVGLEPGDVLRVVRWVQVRVDRVGRDARVAQPTADLVRREPRGEPQAGCGVAEIVYTDRRYRGAGECWLEVVPAKAREIPDPPIVNAVRPRRPPRPEQGVTVAGARMLHLVRFEVCDRPTVEQRHVPRRQ